MRAFIFVICAAAVVVARPEAGYSYSGINQRGTTGSSHIPRPYVHQQLPHEHSFANFGSVQMTFAAPEPTPMEHHHSVLPSASPSQSTQANIFAPSAPSAPSGPAASAFTPNAFSSNDNFNLNENHNYHHNHNHQEDSYNMAYQHSSTPYETGYPSAPQETQIHKHIYVHVPPKDFEEDYIQPRVRHESAPRQKHYKIVFIKAPAAPEIRPPVIPAPLENEEKTLIYVLHKRPEDNQEIVIPTAAPTKPPKPEVYFIKYKTKKEEAPVYGPPPSASNAAPRNVEHSAAYGAPIVDSTPLKGSAELSLPITTAEPIEEEQPPQRSAPSSSYGPPQQASSKMAPIVAELPKTTLATPSSRYLTPEPTQAAIVVEETRVPSNNYGPPSRFFIKKKK